MSERDIFLAAVEIADPDDRAAYLDQACDGNPELRAQAEQLLRTHGEASQFLETPAVPAETAVTQIYWSDASDTDDDIAIKRVSGEAEFRRYLAPATRQGWLGRLGHYEIEEIVGRGAFGIVAKAFDEKLHRVVAIKLMSPELASTSPPRKRFLREARTAAAIAHENVVAIHAVEEEPIPYLVMEYVLGRTLQNVIDVQGPLEVAEVLRIGREVAAGLAAAHATNLIHRDIKPSNILLSDGLNSRVKISDFGLARAVDDASMTSSGVIAGTPMYMAPEQARGHSLDHRADLFSLGSVLHHMVSGRPPFRASNTVAVLKRVCEDTPRALSDVQPGTPGWLETIIFRLLEKDREDRIQTAQELADLLTCCQRELEHDGKVTCVEARPGFADTQVLSAKKKASNRGKGSSIAWLTGGIMAVAAFVALVATNGRKSTPQPEPDGRPAETTAASTVATPAKPPEAVPEAIPEALPWHGWPADAPVPAVAPFTATQATAHQEAWAKYLGVPVEFENSLGMKFRLIPPGEFLMGSTPEEIEAASSAEGRNRKLREAAGNATPLHHVTLTRPFYIGATEVTQTQYEQLLGTNPASFSATGGAKDKVVDLDTADHPVETVSWNDAINFCNQLSERDESRPSNGGDGETVSSSESITYRLPTAAEWEFACRAGTTSMFWNGPDEQSLFEAGWFSSNSSARTHAVATLQSNPFGLFDTHGNVLEWTKDASHVANHFGSPIPEETEIDPSSPVVRRSRIESRGGCWTNHFSFCCSSAQHALFRSQTVHNVGFRVVADIEKVLE